LVLRARRHFCFIQTFFLCLGVGSSFCVGDSKKKNLIPKDKNNQPKAQERENFVSRRYFVRANASVYLQNERRSQNSLSFYSVCFSFVGVYWFITKTDTHYRESALFFWSRACIFYTSSSSKKRRGKFFFGLSERLGRNECPSSELCSHVHERLWMKRVWFLTTRGRFEKVFL
jgi:hypothetical protein